MPLLAINADKDVPVWHDGGHPVAGDTLSAQVPATGPVVVMLHGYKFLPGDTLHCPHTHILSLGGTRDCPKALSWPRHLGFGRGNPAEGLAVAFGWRARGTIWNAYAEAERAGRALARLVAMLAAAAPGRPVHILAHSLGARVALSALRGAPAGSVGRLILMAGAEYGDPARAALDSPAGRRAELVNITSRENDLYDFLLERLVVPDMRGDRAIGHGIGPVRNALTVQLDKPAHLDALAGLGFRIAPPDRRVCHWSGYLRPGVFPFYQSLIRKPAELPIPVLRSQLDGAPSRRWSRLLAPPQIQRPAFWTARPTA